MPLISQSIPNLINGVSQQPPSLRLKTQAEDQVNGLSSVVEGLKKRPCTEHVAKLNITGIDDAFIHTIRRDENEFYTVVIINGVLRVFDRNGIEKTVNGSTSYLNGLTTPSTQITATSVADYTFIANKTKVVGKAATLSPIRPYEAMVYVKQGDYKTDYMVTVRNTSGGVIASASKQTADASVSANQADIRTNKIAEDLFNGLSLPAGFSKELIGSVIYISSTSQDFNVGTTDSRGDTFLLAFKGQAADFNKLPPKGKLGFTIKVMGDTEQKQDDYYVSLQDITDNGTYVWQETIADGIETELDKYTMPHKLVREADGTFTFSPIDWDARQVGDDDSNSFPSFVGVGINDVFFHRNRLGFLADENIIFSEASNYFNYFLPTIITSLESSPIDVAVSNNQVSILKHAIPFNESLLLFSDLTQFTLKADGLLTPDTVSIDVTSNFETSSRAKPVPAGKFVFFSTKRGKWAGIREYFVETSTDNTTNAVEVTAHVPQYIEGEIKKMTASSNEDMLACIATGVPNSLFVYKYFWNNNEKLQSSWSRWDFDGRVLNAEFNNSEIVVLIKRPDGVCLERINLSTDTAREFTTGSFPINLDRRVKLTSGGTTVIPYVDSNTVYVASNGKVITQPQVATWLASGPVYAGVRYNFKYKFSEQVITQEKAPVTIGRLQLRNMNIVFNDSGYFKVVVAPLHRTPSEYVFTGRFLGSASNLVGQVSIDSGTFKVPVLAKNSEVDITIESDSHLPCIFQSAEWEGMYVLRSQRI